MTISVKIDFLAYENLKGLKNLYEQGFGCSVIDFENMIQTYNKIKDNINYNILCAEIDEEIVGSVMGVVCHELFGKCMPFMVVENVVVLEKFRKQGIATQLMIQLENRAKEMNCSSILFVSSEHRVGAHKLYESLGFGVDKVNGYRKRLNY